MLHLKPQTVITLTLLLLIVIGVWQSQIDFSGVEGFLKENAALGAIVYVLYLIAAVVLFPLASLPMLPIAARIFGPWITAALSILGWWIGCLIAFQIARRGRHLLEKFVSLQTLDNFEKQVPPDLNFFGVMILRMILPVDITSYALGLLRHLRFGTYAIASLIGMIPFALLWSLAGGQLARGQWLSALAFFFLLVILVFCVRLYWEKRQRATSSMRHYDTEK